jgi:4-aminobutyrate aminotransferase/(S)-3-amino-2-methylpropionate transaminase
LQQIQAANPTIVGDVRGLGPMLALEIVQDAASKVPDMETTAKITAGTLARGLITIRAGLYSNCIRLLPPLTVTDEEIDEAMGILREAVAEASG